MAPKTKASRIRVTQKQKELCFASEEQDPKKKKLDQANMVTSLKKASGDPVVDAARKEVLALYRSLPHKGHEKADFLMQWKGDKSCKWVNEYKALHCSSSSASSTTIKGHGTVYDIAHIVHMDYSKEDQKIIVDTLCEGLEQDDNWNEDIPLELGYKRAGLKRFKINHSLWANYTQEETHHETFASAIDKHEKQSFQEVKATSSCHIQRVKEEVPGKRALEDLCKVLKSGAGKLEASIGDTKKLVASVSVQKDHAEGEARAQETVRVLQNQEAVQGRLLCLLALADKKTLTEEETARAFEEGNALKQEIENHLDAAKLAKRRIRCWLAAI